MSYFFKKSLKSLKKLKKGNLENLEKAGNCSLDIFPFIQCLFYSVIV